MRRFMMTKKHLVEVIIGILAIVSIVLVAIESIVTVSREALWGIYTADLVICIVFAVDFLWRLKASENKSRFIRSNSYEILAMIPAMGLYALGTIPAISVAFRFLRLVRVFILLSRMKRVLSRSGGFWQRSNLIALLSITISIIFIGALVVLVLESGTPGAQITNFSDAVWWCISTVTTVGYGDIVPESLAGRIIGMVLMVVGIGVMAAFIAQVSATLVESRIKKRVEGDLKATVITEIKNRLDNIEKMSDTEVSLMVQMIQSLRLKEGNNA
jgi:voltage-gated potassium channel